MSADRETLLALLAEAKEALKGLRKVLNASFNAGTEEREGGSVRRQGKELDYVREFEAKVKATFTRIDDALAAERESRG